MSVIVTFKCDGCKAEAPGTRWLERTTTPMFCSDEQFRRQGGGFVRHTFTTPQDVKPEGWIAFDPYTGCCYCPTCWASIEAPKEGAKS